MAKCSYCGRDNPDGLLACAGCGTNLSSMPSDSTGLSAYSPVARRRILTRATWLIGGLVVTGLTYSAASHGGTYVVAWGAMLWGAFQLFQGLFGGKRPPRLENAGYDELEAATRLEAQGRIHEAVAAYTLVAERYGSTPAGGDARKSLESLQTRLK